MKEKRHHEFIYHTVRSKSSSPLNGSRMNHDFRYEYRILRSCLGFRRIALRSRASKREIAFRFQSQKSTGSFTRRGLMKICKEDSVNGRGCCTLLRYDGTAVEVTSPLGMKITIWRADTRAKRDFAPFGRFRRSVNYANSIFIGLYRARIVLHGTAEDGIMGRWAFGDTFANLIYFLFFVILRLD